MWITNFIQLFIIVRKNYPPVNKNNSMIAGYRDKIALTNSHRNYTKLIHRFIYNHEKI